MGTGQGGFGWTPGLSEKYDPTLNDLVSKIKRIRTKDGHDAFTQFKQGKISKEELSVLIAKSTLEGK